jgi:AcrR family transcriptional regulator
VSAVDQPRRGRPRSASSEKAILHAALDLLAEGQGPASLSIAQVAKRAGAGKDTIYRRWHTKEDLLLEALASSMQTVALADGTPLREGLVMMLAEPIARLQRQRDRQILRSLQSIGDDFPRLRERYYAQVVRRRTDAITEQVQAARDRGELRDDVDVRQIIEMPFHHVLMRALEDDPVSGDPEQAAAMLVDAILPAIRATIAQPDRSGPMAG